MKTKHHRNSKHQSHSPGPQGQHSTEIPSHSTSPSTISTISTMSTFTNSPTTQNTPKIIDKSPSPFLSSSPSHYPVIFPDVSNQNKTFDQIPLILENCLRFNEMIVNSLELQEEPFVLYKTRFNLNVILFLRGK